MATYARRALKLCLAACWCTIAMGAPGQRAHAQGSPTVLPTDLVPLPAPQERETFGETFKLKTLQLLPSNFYFSSSVETSLRNETNVYQNPTYEAADDFVFRVFPNITAGWAFTEKTRVFSNYFLIRDQLFRNNSLNSVTQSVGGGIQHDFTLTKKSMLQANAQFRELFQTNQIPVFDYLPGLTYQYYVTPHSVAYINTILQLRGKQPFVSPNREIDPFYTIGYLWQHKMWTLSAAGTFLQNFRNIFGANAFIPYNNYSFILDFEADRQLTKRVPGLLAFIRAEPIFNFHSDAQPSISGFDFRIFGGLRLTAGKVPLTAAIKQLRDQLEEPMPAPAPRAPQPSPSSSYDMREEWVTARLQPIHGYAYAVDSPIFTKLVPHYDYSMQPPHRVLAMRRQSLTK